MRFVIHDNPGVLAAIAARFAEHGVSINGVNQDLKPTLKDPGYDGELQQLRLVTHMTDELTLRETVKDVCALDCVVGELPSSACSTNSYETAAQIVAIWRPSLYSYSGCCVGQLLADCLLNRPLIMGLNLTLVPFRVYGATFVKKM